MTKLSSEVNNLKSEILFGSSHCSCTSCDTVRCFTKRNIIENKCRCPLCKEPTTCMYNVKNLPVKAALKTDGSKGSETPNKQVKVSHSPSRKRIARRNLRDDRSVINIQLVKKNVYIQTQPHEFEEELPKCRVTERKSQEGSGAANNALVSILRQLLPKYNGVSMQNVIGRIAEMCSCEVCDCVLASPHAGCDCQPCQCTDCTAALPSAVPSAAVARTDRTAYTCINSQPFRHVSQRCKDELVSINENDPCDCKPCDCDECKIYNINVNDEGRSQNFRMSMAQKAKKATVLVRGPSNSSSCKSFQCAKCKSLLKPSKNVIVAPVTEYPQQFNSCSCSPCDCNNCRLNRLEASVSARGMREISTGMMQNLNCKCTQCLNQTCKQTTSSCHCESRNSVINKPFDNNDQNIDIHSALIAKKASNQSCAVSALTDVVLDLLEQNVNKINYESYKDNFNCESKNEASASKSASFCHVKKISTIRMNDRRVSQCQCNPCECKICDHFKRKATEQGVLKSDLFRSKCDCDICRCLYCGGLLQFRDLGDNNNIGQLSSKNCKASKPANNRDRSVYLALLHDVYSSYTYAIKSNRSDLLSDKATIVQSANNHLVKCTSADHLSSLYSAFSVSKNMRNTEKHDAVSSDNQLHESFEKHLQNYQKFLKNNVVETFVSKIVRTEKLSDLNIDVPRPSKDKGISTKGESSTFFPETKTQARYKTMDRNGQSGQRSNESFGDSIARTRFKTKHSESKIYKNYFIKLVRESFGKTNLALKDCEKDYHNVNAGSTFRVIQASGFKLKANDVVIETNDEDCLPTPENYLEKRNILFKAKLLTCELLKMLYQCQKAHNEFKSVTRNLSINCDSNKNEDVTIHHKTVELCNKTNVSNSDFKCTWTKIARTNGDREAGLEEEEKNNGSMVSNKTLLFSNIDQNAEIKHLRTYSKLNVHHVDVVENKNSMHVSRHFHSVNEFTNTHNKLKCASHLTTIFKKAGSKNMSNNSNEFNHHRYNTWNVNRKGETANHNKIKYIDINNGDKNELYNKQQYILIENMVTKAKEYKSEIGEHLYI